MEDRGAPEGSVMGGALTCQTCQAPCLGLEAEQGTFPDTAGPDTRLPFGKYDLLFLSTSKVWLVGPFQVASDLHRLLLRPLNPVLREVLAGHFAEPPSGQESLPHFVST